MKRLFFANLVLVFLSAACSAPEQKEPKVAQKNQFASNQDSLVEARKEYIEDHPYKGIYTTVLRNRCSLDFVHNDKYEFLVFKNSAGYVDTLRRASILASYSSLGVVFMDFESTFIMMYDDGNYGSRHVAVYDKKTAKNILPPKSLLYDYNKDLGVLLTSTVGSLTPGTEVLLYDGNKNAISKVKVPEKSAGQQALPLVIKKAKNGTIGLSYGM